MQTIITRYGLWLLLFTGVHQLVWAGRMATEDPVLPATQSVFQLAQYEDVQNYLTKWAHRKARYSDQVAFLRAFFYRTHQKFLKEYVPYTSIEQTLKNGDYDCVSGTALLAAFLQALEVPFEIRETGYHVFVIAQVENKFILLESTDPNNGFVDDQQAIIHQIQQYIFDGLDAAMVSKPIHNTISLEQLQGLMHYNQALHAFHAQDRAAAELYLGFALSKYDSPRIRAMHDLMKQHPDQVVVSEW